MVGLASEMSAYSFAWIIINVLLNPIIINNQNHPQNHNLNGLLTIQPGLLQAHPPVHHPWGPDFRSWETQRPSWGGQW